MTAPEVVGTPTTFASVTSGTTCPLDRPTVAQTGDFLVAGLRTNGSTSPSDFALAGWTRRGYLFKPNDAAGRVTGLYTHPITDISTEPATYTFAKSVADARRVGVMIAVRGVDLSNPVAGNSVGWDAAGAPTVVLNSFTVDTADDALLLYLWAAEIVSPNASAPTVVPGTALALVPSSTGTGSTRTTLWLGSQLNQATATGNKSLTWASSTGEAASGLVLRGLNVVSRTADVTAAVVLSATSTVEVSRTAGVAAAPVLSATATTTVSRTATVTVAVSVSAALGTPEVARSASVTAVVGVSAVAVVEVTRTASVVAAAVVSAGLAVEVTRSAVIEVAVLLTAVTAGPPFPDVLTLAGGVGQYTLDGSVKVLTLEAR